MVAVEGHMHDERMIFWGHFVPLAEMGISITMNNEIEKLLYIIYKSKCHINMKILEVVIF